MQVKNEKYNFQVMIFLCMGIPWRIYQYQITNIALCYNSSFKKGSIRKKMQPNSTFSKIKTRSGRLLNIGVLPSTGESKIYLQ